MAHQDAGGPVGQRAVGDVGVSRDPADVRRAPVHVVGLVVEHQLEGGGGVEHVAADRVEDSLQTRGASEGETSHSTTAGGALTKLISSCF